MPNPSDGENHDDYLKRCVPMVIADGTAKDGAQGAAVCESMWAEHAKGMKSAAASDEPRLTTLAVRQAPDAKVRIEKYKGREHLVVPVVALVGDAVVRPVGATGPEFVPAGELASAPGGWNGRPLLADHPEAGRASANSPRTLESAAFGRLFNTRYANGALQTEAWADTARAAELGGDAVEIVRKWRAGEMVECSVGAYVTAVHQPGRSPGGQDYEYVWSRIVPDHLAVGLAGKRGACSVEAGCGAPRAAAEDGQTEIEFKVAEGRRNSAADQARIQEVHDHSAKLGAACGEGMKAAYSDDQVRDDSGRWTDGGGGGGGGGSKSEEARIVREEKGRSDAQLKAKDMVAKAPQINKLMDRLSAVGKARSDGGVKNPPSKWNYNREQKDLVAQLAQHGLHVESDWTGRVEWSILPKLTDYLGYDAQKEITDAIDAHRGQRGLSALVMKAAAGARHSAKDQKMVQTVHDHACALGAECPGMKAAAEAVFAPTIKAACAVVGLKARKGVQMDKSELIGRLVSNVATPFTEADRETLAEFSDERLTAMAAHCDAAAKNEADLAALRAAAAKPKTEAEILASLPEGLRAMFAEYQARDAAERTALLTGLRAAKVAFTDEALAKWETGDLRALADTLKLDRPAVDYSGKGLPVQRAAAEEAPPPPPDGWAEGLRARAAQRAN